MPAVSALGRLRRLGPVFRSKDAVEAGVSWRDLYRLRDGGEILELSRGVYQLVQTRLAELAQPLRAWAPLSAAMRVLGE